MATKKVFQVYKSSLKSHKIIAPDGRSLNVVNFRFITDDERDIAFLDEEIKNKFPYLRKMDAVELEAEDPMAKLRQQIAEEAIAKYKAEQEALASASDVPDTGESQSAQATLSPASTAKLAQLASKSDSK